MQLTKPPEIKQNAVGGRKTEKAIQPYASLTSHDEEGMQNMSPDPPKSKKLADILKRKGSQGGNGQSP